MKRRSPGTPSHSQRWLSLVENNPIFAELERAGTLPNLDDMLLLTTPRSLHSVAILEAALKVYTERARAWKKDSPGASQHWADRAVGIRTTLCEALRVSIAQDESSIKWGLNLSERELALLESKRARLAELEGK